jgi:hypothetical protein
MVYSARAQPNSSHRWAFVSLIAVVTAAVWVLAVRKGGS